MEKPFSLYETRKLVGKYQLEIISASRLTEILNEKAEEYAKSKIDALRGVSNWIRFKDKDPEEDVTVLFRQPDNEYVCGFILGEKVLIDGQTTLTLHEMDDWHWKPIPE